MKELKSWALLIVVALVIHAFTHSFILQVIGVFIVLGLFEKKSKTRLFK